MKKRVLIFALVFPIVILMAVTFNKYRKVVWGTEFIIPIEGFDPRDLLSGHYLIYRVKYGSSDYCTDSDYNYNNREAYMCLKEKADRYNSEMFYSDYDIKGKECDAVINGRCENGRFIAGIERFYIPEEYANKLDKIIRKGNGKIVISVTSNGNAAVKDLLVDDKSWREYIKIEDDE